MAWDICLKPNSSFYRINAVNRMKMKVTLNARVTFAYLIITTILFTIAGIVLFIYLRMEVDEKVDWKLYADKQRIIEASKDTLTHHEKRSMYQTINLISQRYVDVERVGVDVVFEDEIKDTLLPTFLYGGDIYRPYRQLRFYTTVGDQVYKVTLRKSQVEEIDLREGIVNSLLYVFIALLVVLIIANYYISKRIWSPFYKTVQEIARYDLAGNRILNLEETGIKEFNVLNRAINSMSEKIRKDFISLKEFTENASHEIQTPLAIIKSKLELFTQSGTLHEEQSRNIQGMYEAVAKLSKLNHSLLLIAKIENAQFVRKEQMNLGSEITKIISNFEDLVEAKRIQISTDLQPEVIREMDRSLTEILLSNIITNAIKHNIQDGRISITLSSDELRISNTGEPLTCDPEELFKRFQKIQRSTESLGLGLSIVKSICDFYHMDITYTCHEGMHTVTVKL